jgi:hypothetical protein
MSQRPPQSTKLISGAVISGTGKNSEGGIQYFEQAIAKDPTYAAAYSGLAGLATRCSDSVPVMDLLPAPADVLQFCA